MFGTYEFLMLWCRAHLVQAETGFLCPITHEPVLAAQNTDGLWVINNWSEDRLSAIEDLNLFGKIS